MYKRDIKRDLKAGSSMRRNIISSKLTTQIHLWVYLVRNFSYVCNYSQTYSKVKLTPTILSNFQGRTAHLLWFRITITLIKVNGAHFPPDADSITSVGDAEANTKLPTVSTTNQLYKCRARPKSNQIELLNIPKVTQIIIFF